MLASRVGEAATVELLEHVGPTLDAAATAVNPTAMQNKAVLLERAIFFAAHVDRPDLVEAFSDRLGDLLLAPEGRSALDAVARWSARR